MSSVKTILKELIIRAEAFGLSEDDLNNVKDLFLNNECALSLDTLITQLYEYHIPIDQEAYEMIEKVSKKLKLPIESYSYIKELIKSVNG